MRQARSWSERKRQARQAVALSAVLLMGCGGDQGPAPVEVEGAWTGAIGSETLSFTVQETSGTVSGSGSLNSTSQAIAVTVSGTFARPAVNLTLTADGFNPIAIQANVGETTLNGSANGSGYVNAVVSLTRQ